MTIDYSKAFNQMSHSDILCNLPELNVHPCAVKLIQSYLTGRARWVRLKGEVSSFKRCLGCGPQGGLLTGVLFILQVNKAGKPCSIQPCLRQEVPLRPAIALSLSRKAWLPHPSQDQKPKDALQQTEKPLGPEENPSMRQKLALSQIRAGSGPDEYPSTRQEGVVLPPCQNKEFLQ